MVKEEEGKWRSREFGGGSRINEWRRRRFGEGRGN